MQFTRIAQLQAELDEVHAALQNPSGASPADPTLAERIRQRIADGILPRDPRPDKVWTARGRDGRCSACEEPILPAQTAYEFEDGGRTFRFHIGCHGLWEGSRRSILICAVCGGMIRHPAELVVTRDDHLAHRICART